MEFIIYGIDFDHKAGEFCNRTTLPYYFICQFCTDYVCEVDGELVTGRSGDYMIVEPGTVIYHGPRPESERGFRNDWIYVDREELARLLEKYPLPTNRPFCISDGSQFLRRAIEKINKELTFAYAGCADKCDMIMAGAIIDIYRSYRGFFVQASTDRLEYARGEIMSDFKRQWTLDEMAALAGYSKSRFCSLYKELYGISPTRDLINYRLERAKRLMLYSNMRISEISESCGFGSIYYFSKCFKNSEGISPTEYKASGGI